MLLSMYDSFKAAKCLVVQLVTRMNGLRRKLTISLNHPLVLPVVPDRRRCRKHRVEEDRAPIPRLVWEGAGRQGEEFILFALNEFHWWTRVALLWWISLSSFKHFSKARVKVWYETAWELLMQLARVKLWILLLVEWMLSNRGLPLAVWHQVYDRLG